MIQVRNRNFIPDLEKEGVLNRPIILEAIDQSGIPAHKRLFSHHTLSSVRRCAFYDVISPPKDYLDLALSSSYNHSCEVFPGKEDVCLQLETIGVDTWRRLKNTLDKKPPKIIPLGHPLKLGGISERLSPYNIKLMNSSHHSAKTAPGYSRQEEGGTVFYY